MFKTLIVSQFLRNCDHAKSRSVIPGPAGVHIADVITQITSSLAHDRSGTFRQ